MMTIIIIRVRCNHDHHHPCTMQSSSLWRSSSSSVYYAIIIRMMIIIIICVRCDDHHDAILIIIIMTIIIIRVLCIRVRCIAMERCVGHTAWAAEGREGWSQAGPKGHKLEVGARRAPKLLVWGIFGKLEVFDNFGHGQFWQFCSQMLWPKSFCFNA